MQDRARHFSEVDRRQRPLAEYPADHVELSCWFCARRGHYRKAELLAQFSGWGLVSLLIHLSADCPRAIKADLGNGCGAHYANLSDRPAPAPTHGVQSPLR